MPFQDVVATDIAVAPEAAWGVVPTAGYRRINRTSWGVNLERDVIRSNRIRFDRQRVFSRHGVERLRGTYEDELSLGGADVFLEALLCGTWTAAVSITGEADVTALSGQRLALVRGDASSWPGLAVGDRVSAEIDGNPYGEGTVTLVAAANLQIRFDADPGISTPLSGAPVVIASLGKTLQNGVAKRSLTAQVAFADVSPAIYRIQRGLVVSDGSLTLNPGEVVTASFSLIGKTEDVQAAPVASSIAEAPDGDVLVAVDGVLRIDGVEVAALTGLSLTIAANTNNGRSVVGSRSIVNISRGTGDVTGTISALLEDRRFIDAFRNEAEIDLVVRLRDRAGTGFLQIHLPRVKINGASMTVSGSEEVIVEAPFEALGAPGGYTVRVQTSAAL